MSICCPCRPVIFLPSAELRGYMLITLETAYIIWETGVSRDYGPCCRWQTSLLWSSINRKPPLYPAIIQLNWLYYFYLSFQHYGVSHPLMFSPKNTTGRHSKGTSSVLTCEYCMFRLMMHQNVGTWKFSSNIAIFWCRLISILTLFSFGVPITKLILLHL